jgi:TRAP-type C4-dicarboxylate transport system substrate-binding protein
MINKRSALLVLYSICIITIIAILPVLAGCQPKTEDTIELSLSSFHQAGTAHDVALQNWAKKIESDSNGRLTIRIYPGSTLIPPPDVVGAIREGVADIGCGQALKDEPGMGLVHRLPSITRGVDHEHCQQITEAIEEKFPDIMASQWADFKLLWFVATQPSGFMLTTNKKVSTLEDLKGLQIRVPGGIMAEVVQALGGTPVSIPVSDWLMALEKGTVDGGCTMIGAIQDFKLEESIHYVTKFYSGSSQVFLLMNKDRWNTLSPDLQAIIDNSLAEAKQDMSNAWGDTEKSAVEYSEANGIEFVELTPEEYERWQQAVQPVYQQVVTELNDMEYPGTEIWDLITSMKK